MVYTITHSYYGVYMHSQPTSYRMGTVTTLMVLPLLVGRGVGPHIGAQETANRSDGLPLLLEKMCPSHGCLYMQQPACVVML